jgi:glycyl-tRNA synthetase beta subunit
MSPCQHPVAVVVWSSGSASQELMASFVLQAAYSRPLRWLLALHGDAVVPFKYAGAAR